MIELVVLLHEVIDVVSDDSRAVATSGFLYCIGVLGDLSDEFLLLGREL